MNEIANVVARKLRGLPADLEEAQVAEGDRCVENCGRLQAEKGSLAQRHGLCVECCTWMQRQGKWQTPPMA